MKSIAAFAFRFLSLALFVIAGTSPCAAAADGSPRTVLPLDRNWRFHLGDVATAVAPEFDDELWRTVDVPHDYVIEGRFSQINPRVYPGMNTAWYSQHAFLPVQPAVYRKVLDIPAWAAGRRVWLEFDGVCSNSRYWLNGMEVGRQYSAYSRSRFDVTSAMKAGAGNVLVVQVDPRYDGWWYEGGGIYRHVRMVILDPVHIAADGVFVMPEVSDAGDGESADAAVTVNTGLANEGACDVSATVLSEILDGAGRVLAADSSAVALRTGAGEGMVQKMPLPGAALWSPEHPVLYQLRSTIFVSGKIVDQVTTNFGVRQIRFDAQRGFFLNGKRVQIRGVNMHQDHAGVGVAVPDRLFTWRLERLKEMGCNAIRMSHNPVEPFLLDECDRLGFLVIAENRHFGDTYEDQTSRDIPAIENTDLKALVLRDRNHPSIILWSLCNEQWIQGTPEAGARAAAMRQCVRELDPSRPVTAAMNGGFDSAGGMAGSLDVIGVNYHPEVYDSVHALFPNAPIVASEIASEQSTRGVYDLTHWEQYWGNPEKGYLAAYSISAGSPGQVVEEAWPPVVSREFIAGGFVWTAFDYKGEPRPFDWPVINSHYGFMDICGFPKDSYYYYQAWWTLEPVLHLFPHWNWQGREGQEIPVWVQTNCEKVELFLNGVSLGVQTVQPLHHLEWKVKYAPGTLVAKGVYKGREIVAARETTGAPAAVRLGVDRSDLVADGADMAVVRVEIVDAQGRVVPVADNSVSFTIRGPGRLIGVGNGDPSSHEPDKGSSRSVFNGLAQALVQTLPQAGTIEVQAESSGLKPFHLLLHARAPQSAQ
jgi:beta-galactosidase